MSRSRDGWVDLGRSVLQEGMMYMWTGQRRLLGCKRWADAVADVQAGVGLGGGECRGDECEPSARSLLGRSVGGSKPPQG
jgi:hypothetical protein